MLRGVSRLARPMGRCAGAPAARAVSFAAASFAPAPACPAVFGPVRAPASVFVFPQALNVRVEPARRSFSSVAPAAAPAAEDLETSYKRLIFHCQQRGWLELDLIMGSFVRLQRAALVDDVVAQEQLRTVAKEENSDLMRWLVEGRPIPEQFLTNPMAVALHTYANSPDKPWYPKAGEGNQ